MKAVVKWSDNLTFIGTTESGHSLMMDGDSGSVAPSPMELLLLAAGGCSSVDVVTILQKARQSVLDCEVEISAERADTTPKVFTKINLHFKVKGTEVAEKHVARAVSLSMDKYCSVSRMLEQAAEVTSSYSIVEA